MANKLENGNKWNDSRDEVRRRCRQHERGWRYNDTADLLEKDSAWRWDYWLWDL